MRHERDLRCGRDKEQMDGSIRNRVARQEQESTVLHEGRVQGAEWIACDVDVASKVPGEHRLCIANGLAQATELDARRQFFQRGKTWVIVAIDEDESGSSAGNLPGCCVLLLKRGCLFFSRQAKWGPDKRGEVGKAPVFIARGRKASLAKAGKGRFAQITQPCRSFRWPLPCEISECFKIAFELGHLYCHGSSSYAETASVSIQP